MSVKRIFLIALCVLVVVLLCACSSNQDAYKAGFEAGLAAAQANVTPQPTRTPSPTLTPKPTQKPSSLLPYVQAYVTQPSSSSDDVTYILNKNTKKFHYPDCSSVYDMKESNKIYFTGSRDEAISQGYVPCKRCNP